MHQPSHTQMMSCVARHRRCILHNLDHLHDYVQTHDVTSPPHTHRYQIVIVEQSYILSFFYLFFSAEIWKTIDTWPGRRSGDMIVITVILSALCGVITIGFLSTVCYEWLVPTLEPWRCKGQVLLVHPIYTQRKMRCWSKTVEKTEGRKECSSKWQKYSGSRGGPPPLPTTGKSRELLTSGPFLAPHLSCRIGNISELQRSS